MKARDEITVKEAVEQRMEVINFWTSKQLKAKAQRKATKQGMSLSAYLRTLLIKDTDESVS